MGVTTDDDNQLKLADYVGVGVRCGLSVRETLQIPVGLLCDLWQLYKDSHGIVTKPIERDF